MFGFGKKLILLFLREGANAQCFFLRTALIYSIERMYLASLKHVLLLLFQRTGSA